MRRARRSKTYKRIFIAYMHDTSDLKDHLAIKVRALTESDAKVIASKYKPERYKLENVYTRLGDLKHMRGIPHHQATPFGYDPSSK